MTLYAILKSAKLVDQNNWISLQENPTNTLTAWECGPWLFLAHFLMTFWYLKLGRQCLTFFLVKKKVTISFLVTISWYLQSRRFPPFPKTTMIIVSLLLFLESILGLYFKSNEQPLQQTVELIAFSPSSQQASSNRELSDGPQVNPSLKQTPFLY